MLAQTGCILALLLATAMSSGCTGRGCETHPVLYSSSYDHSFESSRARIQQPAPDFTTDAVVDGQIKKISLSDYKGKYVVLVFFPLAFTFACPSECISKIVMGQLCDVCAVLAACLLSSSTQGHGNI
eukprot:m.52579 g.52579  ORF g.52579 m.52579 type:complete len:127 (-) comp13511_c0_seq2:631-1011(-)